MARQRLARDISQRHQHKQSAVPPDDSGISQLGTMVRWKILDVKCIVCSAETTMRHDIAAIENSVRLPRILQDQLLGNLRIKGFHFSNLIGDTTAFGNPLGFRDHDESQAQHRPK
jgi:hypothetical protein